MNILTVDTVLNKTYIAFSFSEKEEFRVIESDDKNYHSAYLAPALYELMKGDMLNKTDYFGVNTGVGSFTGIRCTLSFIKVIANRLNKKVVPFNTMEVLSLAYNNQNIMLDARKGQVFYSNDGTTIDLISYEDAKNLIKKEKIICDNSLYEKFDSPFLISYEKENINLAPCELELVKNKIQKGDILSALELKPVYIQTPPIFMK